jgi:hypothetical protein
VQFFKNTKSYLSATLHKYNFDIFLDFHTPLMNVPLRYSGTVLSLAELLRGNKRGCRYLYYETFIASNFFYFSQGLREEITVRWLFIKAVIHRNAFSSYHLFIESTYKWLIHQMA